MYKKNSNKNIGTFCPNFFLYFLCKTKIRLITLKIIFSFNLSQLWLRKLYSG